MLKSIPFIIDANNSFGQPHPALRLVPERARIDRYGLSDRQVLDSIATLMGGQGDQPPSAMCRAAPTANRCRSNSSSTSGQALNLGALVHARMERGRQAVFRRDGRGATMVSAELAGRHEASIDGMLAVDRAMDAYDWKGQGRGLLKPAIAPHGQPEDESRSTLLWDGEWKITWATFRDMVGAFMVALLGIYKSPCAPH